MPFNSDPVFPGTLLLAQYSTGRTIENLLPLSTVGLLDLVTRQKEVYPLNPGYRTCEKLCDLGVHEFFFFDQELAMAAGDWGTGPFHRYGAVQPGICQVACPSPALSQPLRRVVTYLSPPAQEHLHVDRKRGDPSSFTSVLSTLTQRGPGPCPAIASGQWKLGPSSNDLLVRDVRRKVDLQGQGLTAAQKEQMADKILQCMGPAVYCFTPDGRVIHWTPAAERLFHWLEEQALGQHVTRLSCAEETVALGHQIVHDIMGRGLPWQGLFTVQNMQGLKFEAIVITNPLFDSRGKFWGTVCIAHPSLPFLHQPFSACAHPAEHTARRKKLQPVPRGRHGVISRSSGLEEEAPDSSAATPQMMPAVKHPQAQWALSADMVSAGFGIFRASMQRHTPSRKRRLEEVRVCTTRSKGDGCAGPFLDTREEGDAVLEGSLGLWVKSQREWRSMASRQLGGSQLSDGPSVQVPAVHGPRMPSWHIPWEKLDMGHVLGDGLSGTVFKAQWEGVDVAVKVFHHSYLSPELVGEFRKEVSIMESLRHPHVLLFLGVVETWPRLCIVSEFMSRGSVFGIMRKPAGRKLSLERRLHMALDTTKGMQYLHSLTPPIIHHDLKSANLLVDSQWRVKVNDFGLSKLKYAAQMSASSGRGTPQWTAPEVLRMECAGEKSDVYSFGVVLWELVTLQAPWEGLNPMQVVGAVGFMGRTLEIPEHLDAGLKVLIQSCWRSNPEDRPCFLKIREALEEVVLKVFPSSVGLSVS